MYLLSSAADFASRGLKELPIHRYPRRGACHPHAGEQFHDSTARCPEVWQHRPAAGYRRRPGARPEALCGRSLLECAGGHGDSYYRPEVHVQREGLINGPEEARRAVRELIKMHADVIKLLVTGGVMTDGSDVGIL